MGNSNILPRGGFFRGVLAGLILIFFVFVGLAVVFPLSVVTGPAPTPVTELNSAPTQPSLDTTESAPAISIPSDAPVPTQLGDNPVPFQAAAPEVAIAPETSAPVNTVSNLDDLPSSSDVQLGSGESTAPAVRLPTIPTVEAPTIVDTPAVEKSTEAPDVTVAISPAIPESDTEAGETSTDEDQSGGHVLSGQTIIQPEDPEQVIVAETPAPSTAFGAYSADFEDIGDLPLMSLILLATTVEEAETVAKLLAPITVAVESSNPAAGDIIASYRALGGEVVLLLPNEGPNALKKGGNPDEVPAQLDAALANSAGVIGVMDGPEGDVNQDAQMLTAILAKLSETGHAIITVNGLGLNRANIMAQESGIPATGILSVIDVTQGTIAVIRELDKIALQLGDQRSITVYALATPDMLFALNFWLESETAKVVTVAPVSASILRN